MTTINKLVDELTYQNYKHNRKLNSSISPEHWKLMYDNVDAMEKRFLDDVYNESLVIKVIAKRA